MSSRFHLHTCCVMSIDVMMMNHQKFYYIILFDELIPRHDFLIMGKWLLSMHLVDSEPMVVVAVPY